MSAANFANRKWERTHVSVEPFRERFLRLREQGEITGCGVARDLGWYKRRSPAEARHRRSIIAPDGGRVTRTLGIRQDHCRGYSYYRQWINYDLAEQLCKALDMDPWEAGI